MKSRDNLFALNYANLFVKFALENKVDFKSLFFQINRFFSILNGQEKKISSLVASVKNDMHFDIIALSKIERIMLSIFLKKKIHIKDKIVYFFTKICNESGYLRFFTIRHARNLSESEKVKIKETFVFDEEKDVVVYEKDDNLIGGFVVENINNLHDFSTLRYLNKLKEFLKKNID